MDNACIYSLLLEIGAKQILIKKYYKHNAILGGLYSSKIIDNIFTASSILPFLIINQRGLSGTNLNRIKNNAEGITWIPNINLQECPPPIWPIK